jgi:Tol biopolymer transport system component
MTGLFSFRRCNQIGFVATLISAIVVLVAAGSANGKSSRAKLIAFTTDRDGNNEIYVMDAAGGKPVNLTRNPASDTFEDWSPDGKKLVFESDRDGQPEVYVMTANGTHQRNLTRNGNADGVPSWSPNGKHVAFYSTRTGSVCVFVMDADGGNVRQLTFGGDDYPTDWSADGRYILFHRFASDVWAVDVVTGEERQLTTSPGMDVDASWFPKSSLIAFSTERYGDREVAFMTPDGDAGPVTRLTNSPGTDGWPHPSPDEQRIAFASDRYGSLDVFVMNVDGSGEERLTTQLATDWLPRWQP